MAVQLKPDRPELLLLWLRLWCRRVEEGEAVLDGLCTYSSARLCCSWPVSGGTAVT